MRHTVLLRSDGQAVSCGNNDDGQCGVPALKGGMSYRQVSAGMYHSVFLRSDGQVLASGSNDHGQCQLPLLAEGLSYIQVSAGGDHTVLLRSDGSAVACGMNDDGECDVPQLDGEVSYLQVSAGICHTVLLRSDGLAAACGLNLEGQCDIPTPEPSNGYIWDHSHMPLGRDLVLQLDYLCDDKNMLTCSNLAGQEMLRLSTSGSDLAWHTQKRIAHELLVSLRSLRVVLPDGRLLTSAESDNPLATISDLI